VYVVAIAWLYVTIVMAATEPSITAAVMTFVSYGLFPLVLILWLVGTPQRHRSMRKRAARDDPDNHDRTDSESD
jgi:hypothetical protein